MKKIYNLSWVDEDNLTHSRVLDPKNKKLLIGRSPSMDIVVTNPSVSRIHAELFWKNNVLNIKDLNSSFGTWINDRRLVTEQNKTLYENGEIRLGSLSIWYEINEMDDSQELLQTCILPQINVDTPILTSELSAFKEKLLKNIKAHCHIDVLTEPLKESLNKEIQLLSEKYEEQLKEQKVLNSISHILNRNNTLSELSKRALNIISRVVNAERGFIVMYGEKAKRFELIAKRNIEKNELLINFTNKTSALVQRSIEDAKIIIVDDAQKDEALFNLETISTPETSSIAVIPLIQREEVIGVIYLDSSRTHCFDERQKSFLQTFALHTSIALHNAQLYKQAITDDLTQLYTRQYINERMEQEHERAKRYQRPFSVLLVDLDRFKLVNDTYGHSAGDLVLKSVSSILIRQLRDTDIAGRLGGEEFIVILGETELEGAKIIAERMREEIEQETIKKDDKLIKVTTSIGVASYNERHKEQFNRLIEDADKALYQAKNDGRNRVIVSPR